MWEVIEQFGRKARAYVVNSFAAIWAFFDHRTVVLSAVCVLLFYFLLNEELKRMALAGANWTIAIAAAVLVGIVCRKVILTEGFKLAAFWKRANDEPMASAVVFATVIAFTAFLIDKALMAFGAR